MARETSTESLAVLICGAVLLVVLLAIGVHEAQRPWRQAQADALSQGVLSERRPTGVFEQRNALGRVERCTTCHVAAVGVRDLSESGSSSAPADDDAPQPLRSHPAPWGSHLAMGMGCEPCHGGTPRALDPATAHGLAGQHTEDPAMRAEWSDVACSRCHTPGAVAGTERLARGAMLMVDLGCVLCHRTAEDGRGGDVAGPDLRGLTRTATQDLANRITSPQDLGLSAEMPSFAATFAEREEELSALLAYLQGEQLERAREGALRDRDRGLIERPCAACHGGAGRSAQGVLEHRCVYIVERTASLACAGCHTSDPRLEQGSAARCVVVEQHRSACGVCHAPAPARGVEW